MKAMKFLLSAAFVLAGVAAMAQDLSDPKYAVWGDTPEERQENILTSQFFKEQLQNKNYNQAAGFYKQLIDKVPGAAESIYQRAAILFGNKFRRAKTLDEQKQAFDSLMMAYDLRLQYFGTSPEKKAEILDRKAREFAIYRKNDREGLRENFKAAIEADREGDYENLYETTVLYYGALVDDFKNDLVYPDELLAEYERLTPIFDNIPADKAEYKDQFEALFGTSGAATCETLEPLFRKKLEANPNDETVLAQAVSMMGRAKCESDFFIETTERYYAVKPTSNTAIFLAQAFQEKKDFVKATTYLREALKAETDPVEREKLYVQIGLAELAANHASAAAEAAREARELNPASGLAYFILAQSYAASSSACSGIARQAVYWVAYDTMSRAYELLENDPGLRENAQKAMSAYRTNWPNAEECFFNELKEGARYTVTCGLASGISTTVRPR